MAPDVTDAEIKTAYCGVGTCRPSALQCFATLPKFTISFGICVIFWSALNVYLVSQIPTLEKEFSISSTTSGTLISTLQYGQIVAMLFVNHFGKRAHIPRLLSSFSIMVGVIALVPVVCELSSLPALPSASDKISSSSLINSSSSHSKENEHFLCVSLKTENASVETVTRKEESADALRRADARRWIVYALGIASVVMGTANSAQLPLPIHYIDNNVKDPSQTALLAGTIYTSAHMGMPVSLAIGTLASKLPVNLDDTALTPEDPRWIGAWWLGFIILGFCCIVFGIPVFFFPKKYKFRHRRLQPSVIILEDNEEDEEPMTTDVHDKKQRATNPASSGEIEQNNSNEKRHKKHAKKAHGHHSPDKIKNRNHGMQKKHHNSHVRVPEKGGAYEQHISEFIKDLPTTLLRILKKPIVLMLLLTGMSATMLYATVRTFASKYLVLQFNIPLWRANMYLSFTGLSAAVLGTFLGGLLSTRLKLARKGGLILSCTLIVPTVVLKMICIFLGCSNPVIVGYSRMAEIESLDCDCDPTEVLLSCGQDGRSYLSPCFAGCTEVNGRVFTACSNVEGGGSVTPGLCEFNCNTLAPFMVLIVAASVLASLGIVPFVLSLIRTVQDRDEAVALALFHIFAALGGFLAGPIIFGKVIDRACLIWSQAATGTGSCLLYDIEKLRFTVFGGLVGLSCISSLALLIALFLDLWQEKKGNNQIEDRGNELTLSESMVMISKF